MTSWLEVWTSLTSGPPTSLSTRSRLPPLKRRSDGDHGRLITLSKRKCMITYLVCVSLISRQEVCTSSADGHPASFSTRSRPHLKRSDVNWRGNSSIRSSTSSSVDVKNSGRDNTCRKSNSMMKLPSVMKRKQESELIPDDFLLRDSRLGFVRKVSKE